MAAKATKASTSSAARAKASSEGARFEATKLDGLFPVLDAIAWMDAPSTNQISQFAGVDPRTAGKLLKNAVQIGLAAKSGSGYVLLVSYPYKGSNDQKREVVRESLVRLPILTSLRQFLQLGETLDHAARKAATINKIVPFNPVDYAPLFDWANALGTLQAGLTQEDLVDSATVAKEERHAVDSSKIVAFISHSSADKPFIRQLASDLTASGVSVWLDEQRIKVGDSIPERISQGLAESDYFLLAVSKHSAGSEWVKKELNGALVNEVQRRKVHVLPLRLDEVAMPPAVQDKKYADFSKSYNKGLKELIGAMKGGSDG